MGATAAILDNGPSPIGEPAPARIVPGLAGVSETMLWALYNRATEAQRPDGILQDPTCIKIYQAMDVQLHAPFRRPRGHARRAGRRNGPGAA